MIRRTIPILFAMTIFFSMTAIVMAESFQINTDKSVVSMGEYVSVNVRLEESMTGQFRNVQGQLYYDTDLLTYVSHQSGEQFSNYTYADMPDRKYFTFTNTDFTDDGFSKINEGKAVSVKFKVNEDVTEEHLKAAFSLKVDIQDIRGEEEEVTSSTALLICNGVHQESASVKGGEHEDQKNSELKGNDKTICEKCGEKYVINKEAEIASVHDNDVHGKNDEKANSLLIAVIITALAAACVLIAYRRKYKR